MSFVLYIRYARKCNRIHDNLRGRIKKTDSKLEIRRNFEQECGRMADMKMWLGALGL
jgi:hypothetical protein